MRGAPIPLNHYRPVSRTVAPVAIPIDDIALEGELFIPNKATGLVVFAHGSGSSRMSPRNRYVAGVLHEHDVGTLLIDLLTAPEEKIDEQTRELRFNIRLLAERLVAISHWVQEQPLLSSLKIGYFGSSTGGAAALIAAAHQPEKIAAVVSRGGRPDLAMNILLQVKAPTLLLVGENDPEVLVLNKQALEKLNDQSKLVIIPHASHLFEEIGALEDVAQFAAEWFEEHLR